MDVLRNVAVLAVGASALVLLATAADADAAAKKAKEKKARFYRRGKLLGRGGFGAVYVYKRNDKDNEKFAGKEVALGGLASMRGNTEKTSSQVQALLNEIEKLQMLKHENIVQLVDFFLDDANLYMVIELMELSLSDLLKKRTIPENEAKLYTRGILDGLIYLHENSVIHCDIKGPNVLLNVGKMAKLGDFGLAQYYEENQSALSIQHTPGTICYMAPELMERKKHGKRADVWAVGCTIYEMLCGKPPFSELNLLQFAMKTKDLAQKDLAQKSTVLRHLEKKFLLRIFVEKDNRPTASTLRDDKWLK